MCTIVTFRRTKFIPFDLLKGDFAIPFYRNRITFSINDANCGISDDICDFHDSMLKYLDEQCNQLYAWRFTRVRNGRDYEILFENAEDSKTFIANFVVLYKLQS